jgi:hypothetical protein
MPVADGIVGLGDVGGGTKDGGAIGSDAAAGTPEEDGAGTTTKYETEAVAVVGSLAGGGCGVVGSRDAVVDAKSPVVLTTGDLVVGEPWWGAIKDGRMANVTEAVVSAGAGAGRSMINEATDRATMGGHTEDGAAAGDATVDVIPIQGPLDESSTDGAPADDGTLDTTDRARTNGAAVARKTLWEWTGSCCAMETVPIIKLLISVHTPHKEGRIRREKFT